MKVKTLFVLLVVVVAAGVGAGLVLVDQNQPDSEAFAVNVTTLWRGDVWGSLGSDEVGIALVWSPLYAGAGHTSVVAMTKDGCVKTESLYAAKRFGSSAVPFWATAVFPITVKGVIRGDDPILQRWKREVKVSKVKVVSLDAWERRYSHVDDYSMWFNNCKDFSRKVMESIVKV